MTARYMPSGLYASKCARCAGRIEKGAPLYYDRTAPKGQRATCPACYGKAPQPAPTPRQDAPQAPQEQDTPMPAGARYSVATAPDGRALVDYVHADSLGALHEFRATVRNALNRPKWEEVKPENRVHGTHDMPAPQWWGVQDGHEARRILDTGEWPEGVQRMLDTIGRIQSTAQPTDSRRRRRWADNGDTVEMSRVWAGRVDVAWQRCTRQTMRAPKPVTILCNVSQAFNLPAEQLYWRGAAACLLADALTEAGYNVEIEAWYFGVNYTERGEGRHIAIGATVKDARSPLDLNALAVTCAFAGFFRGEIFQAICSMPHAVNSGLGGPVAYRQLITPATDPREPIVCEGIRDAEGARQWIAAALAKIEGGAEAIAA